MDDNHFIEIAIKEAQEGVNSGHGGPFGAVIVKDGFLISSAHNEVILRNDPTAHAEILAIRKACEILKTFKLQGSTIICTCEPCPMCLSAIMWAGIDKVVFGCNSLDAANIGFNDEKIYNFIKGTEELSLKILPDFQREKCLDVFKIWQSKEDKITY